MPVLVADLYADIELPNLEEFNPEDIKLDGTVVAICQLWITRHYTDFRSAAH